MIPAGRPVLAHLVPALAAVLSGLVFSACQKENSPERSALVPKGEITFNKHVAPILFQNCAPCHRPGQSAPFSLLSHADAKKHAGEIARATQKRYMPPWLPEPGYGEFLDERRLTDEQIATIQKWHAAGEPEGDPADLPSLPKFADGWQLGEPDLVVSLPQSYALAAEGPDVYRNFVIPTPVNETRFVRALEFHPKNKSVHHVRILLDATRQSRRLDEQDAEPGFAGMTVPAKFPTGHMLTWGPGRMPTKEPDGLEWILPGGDDLVLQIHMQRSGKLELIEPEIGLCFTNRPPAKTPYRVGLLSELIDIPAGEKNYVVERTIDLAADVDVLAILPHLHFLGRRIEGFATLPNGQRQWLLLIQDWDFNWQSEYHYRRPIFLPKGSMITMRYTYDNSAENVRNPSVPPHRVAFGPQSIDEMGELWLQVLPRRASDLITLQNAHKSFSFQETAAFFANQLRANPNDSRAHFGLGKVLGPLGQMENALGHFQAAVRLEPDFADAHYYLGLALHELRRADEAQAEFETTLRLNPAYFKAHDGLGLVFLQRNNPEQSIQHFQAALKLNPDDAVARGHLERLVKQE